MTVVWVSILIYFHLCRSCNLADISTGVAGLLLTVWGVWGAARSYFFLPQSLQAGSCLRLVLKHVRSNHKLCFWLCQSWFQGGVNWIMCWFLIKKLSLSLPPQLSNWHQGGDLKVSQPREAQGISGTSQSTERVMPQSTVREDPISLGAHAEPADRAVTCPWGQTPPLSLSAGGLCTVAADRQPGNHCLTGKAEGETKMSSKSKVWLTENTVRAGAGSCWKEKTKMVRKKVETTKWCNSLLRVTQQDGGRSWTELSWCLV